LAETLAFVVPWYGSRAAGGAESECHGTARALAARGVRIEILTTCARAHASAWVNYHPEGPAEENGLPVRRFKVRPRNTHEFVRLLQRLELGGTLAPWEEETLVRESIHSDSLYGYLATERERYWYVFIPYCFGTTWEGALIAPERSLLIPCLHDEPFAHLGATKQVLRAVRGVCFHVTAERALGVAVADGDPGTFFLVGEGVDTDIAGNAERFRRRYHVPGPFLLYAGRKATEKNTHLLLDYYARYRFTHPDRPLKLLLIGTGGVRIPERLAHDILDLGFLPVQDKYDAYAAALALCQPSLLESFSIVMMEAWLCGTPSLVHARCAVTRDHCLASNAGLWFEDYFEFVEAVELLQNGPALRRRLADNGRAYVLANFTWDRVTGNYLDVLRRVGARVG